MMLYFRMPRISDGAVNWTSRRARTATRAFQVVNEHVLRALGVGSAFSLMNTFGRADTNTISAAFARITDNRVRHC